MSHGTEALIHRMAELQRAFKARLGERFRALRAVIDGLGEGRPFDDSSVGLETLQAECHKLVGTGATLGFPAISESARKLEAVTIEMLAAARPLTPGDIGALASRLGDLEDRSRAPSADLVIDVAALGFTHEPVDPAAKADRTVIIVDDDPALTDVLRAQLPNFGFGTVVRANPSQLRESILQTPPAAILMDIVFPDDRDAGIKAIQALRDEGLIGCPVVFLCRSATISMRA